MLYHEYLNNLHHCPFCNPTQGIFIKNESSYLTFALAPYHRHHLLVIPDQHIVSFLDLRRKDKENIDELIVQGTKILKQLGYGDITVLVRDGTNSLKSIEHLHYHIIPNTHIGDLDHEGNERRLLNDDNVKQVMSDVNAAIDVID